MLGYNTEMRPYYADLLNEAYETKKILHELFTTLEQNPICCKNQLTSILTLRKLLYLEWSFKQILSGCTAY